MLMRRWICLLLSAWLLVLAAGCGQEDRAQRQDWDAVQADGTLRIGVTQCPPFSQKGPDGTWSGFDMDLARAVCEKLEVEPVFVELDWSGRTDALNRGEVMCLWSGLTARSDLLETLDFTQTYLASRPVLVVLWEDVELYRTVEQLKGKTLAVESGSAEESAVAACLPEAEADPVASQQAALEAVLDGTAQGAVVDLLVARNAVETNQKLTVQMSLELGTEELAVAVARSSDLTAKINQALTALQQEGVLDDLAAQYGLTEELIAG